MPAAAKIASSRARHTCCQEGRRSQAVPASQLSKIRSRAAQAALSVSIDHLLMRVPGVLVGLCAQLLGAAGGRTASVAPNCCLIENIFSTVNGDDKAGLAAPALSYCPAWAAYPVSQYCAVLPPRH